MLSRFYKLVYILVAFQLACSTSHDTQVLLEEIISQEPQLAENTSELSSYQKLNQSLQKTPKLRAHVQDYLSYFKALDHIKAGQPNEAKPLLEQALESSESKIRRAAQLELNTLNEKYTTSESTLSPLFKIEFPAAKDLQSDLYLKNTINFACKSSDSSNWKSWSRKALKQHQQDYFLGKLNICLYKDKQSSIQHFKSSYSKNHKSPQNLGYALHALKELIPLLKNSGYREESSKFYLKLSDLWQNPNLTPKLLGIKPNEFMNQKFNDMLWAARSLIIQGQHHVAKLHLEKTLKLINKQMLSEPIATSPNIHEYFAEAMHLLAFRIYVEQNNYEQAISTNELALKNQRLNDEWLKRLKWYSGLYAYILKKYDLAKYYWEDLKDSFPEDEKVQVQTLFWLGKIHQINNAQELAASTHQELTEKYPNNFYTIVALNKFNPVSYQSENELVVQSKRVAAKICSNSLESHHIRSLILMNAKIKEWDWSALQQFYYQAKSKLPINDTNNHDVFVYISKLFVRNGNYQQAIALTTELANANKKFWYDFPEHLYAYYPRPYNKEYEIAAKDTDLDSSLLYAISRQESSFNPNATSQVGAMGLMQLMPYTAKQVAKEKNIFLKNSDELTKPHLNIQLGAQLIKKLKFKLGEYLPAVFASYNAGEDVVQDWQLRRKQEDPLLWIELIPYGETQTYTKLVWRNYIIYQQLEAVQFASSP